MTISAPNMIWTVWGNTRIGSQCPEERTAFPICTWGIYELIWVCRRVLVCDSEEEKWELLPHSLKYQFILKFPLLNLTRSLQDGLALSSVISKDSKCTSQEPSISFYCRLQQNVKAKSHTSCVSSEQLSCNNVKTLQKTRCLPREKPARRRC